MSKKSDAFYFENFIAVARLCAEAADYLVDCLVNYKPEEIKDRMVTMHTYEHSADIKKHEMSHALAGAFITPLEREDLADISYNLDEVADNIEEVLQRFYMDEPKAVTEDSILFAKNVAACCREMENMFLELPNYKKPQKLKETIIRISDIEEECDKLYLKAYKEIKQQTDDVLEVVGWRKIYDYLERCTDACEHVADSVDMIVMKNS